MAYDIVKTLELTLDEDGFLNAELFKDLGSDAKQPSERSFYFEVYYKDNPQVVVATSNKITITHAVKKLNDGDDNSTPEGEEELEL